MVTKRKGRLKKLKGRMQSSLSGFFRACMVGALVLFQFAIIVATPFLFREFALQFYILIEVCGIIGILALTNDSRNYSYKYSWLSHMAYRHSNGQKNHIHKIKVNESLKRNPVIRPVGWLSR